MSKPQGTKRNSSVFIPCPHCSRSFRVRPSEVARRGTLFCSRKCFFEVWREFSQAYRARRTKELQDLASS
jgi:hypothetical protein